MADHIWPPPPPRPAQRPPPQAPSYCSTPGPRGPNGRDPAGGTQGLATQPRGPQAFNILEKLGHAKFPSFWILLLLLLPPWSWPRP